MSISKSKKDALNWGASTFVSLQEDHVLLHLMMTKLLRVVLQIIFIYRFYDGPICILDGYCSEKMTNIQIEDDNKKIFLINYKYNDYTDLFRKSVTI